MSEACPSVRRGLEEALAHAEGRRDGAVTYAACAPEPDVATIRARSGLSQAAFARSIGVAVADLMATVGCISDEIRVDGGSRAFALRPARPLAAFGRRLVGLADDAERRRAVETLAARPPRRAPRPERLRRRRVRSRGVCS